MAYQVLQILPSPLLENTVLYTPGVLKETLAYDTVDGGTAFCTLLDATKAFDRVNYCKLFRILLDRDISPAVFIFVCFSIHTRTSNSVVCVSWNGVCSRSFVIENGVRQGGIAESYTFLYLS